MGVSVPCSIPDDANHYSYNATAFNGLKAYNMSSRTEGLSPTAFKVIPRTQRRHWGYTRPRIEHQLKWLYRFLSNLKKQCKIRL